MASFGGWDSQSYAWPCPPATSPSVPSLPEHSRIDSPYGSFQSSYMFPGQLHNGCGQVVPTASPGYYYGQPLFPPGTDPDVVRAFQIVDRDGSGFIDERELQQALCTGYRRFDARTIRLLMFLFRNPSEPLRVGKHFPPFFLYPYRSVRASFLF